MQQCIINPQTTTCQQFTVEQGPVWLAELFYSPPIWVLPAMLGVAALIAAGGIWGYRRYGLSDETKIRMLFNVTVALGVIFGVRLSMRSLGLPYLGDVFLGLLAGFSVAVALRRWCYVPLVENHQ